ncbi:MAG: cytochrome c [Granulosicoccus sp.]
MNKLFSVLGCTGNASSTFFISSAFVLLLLWNGHSVASSGLAEYDQPWEICALCHSLDGNSRMAKFPKLAGQRKAYIEKQLVDFLHARRRNDGGQMSSIVTEVDPVVFSQIAQWFSSQEPPEPEEVDPFDIAAGKDLFLKGGCGSCHVNGPSTPSLSHVPLLSSQHAAYLAKQLKDFQIGQRVHTDDPLVSDAILALSQPEVLSISAYLAATPRR